MYTPHPRSRLHLDGCHIERKVARDEHRPHFSWNARFNSPLQPTSRSRETNSTDIGAMWTAWCLLYPPHQICSAIPVKCMGILETVPKTLYRILANGAFVAVAAVIAVATTVEVFVVVVVVSVVDVLLVSVAGVSSPRLLLPRRFAHLDETINICLPNPHTKCSTPAILMTRRI